MSAAQATQEVISRLPQTTGEEFEAAVGAARDAFPAWRQTPVPTRARVMLKLQQLIRENMVRGASLNRPGAAASPASPVRNAGPQYMSGCVVRCSVDNTTEGQAPHSYHSLVLRQ